MGWLGWTLVTILLLAALGFLALRHAIDRNGAAVLDTADRVLRGGDGEARLAARARYGNDPAQVAEMYVPRTARGPVPLVVFIHGGSWASGRPQDYRFMARTLAAHGYGVVLPGYRLFPAVRYPAMLEDAAAALAWTVRHAAGHGGDPARIVVMGHSAGAYNAVMVALEPRWLAAHGLSPALLKGAVGLAGPYDFLPLDTEATIDSFGQAPDLAPTQPVNHARADAPPLLLVTGDADTRVKPRNAIALARAMTEAGAPTEAVLLEGLTHEGIIMKFARPFAGDTRPLDTVLPFLARVTAPAPSAPVQANVR